MKLNNNLGINSSIIKVSFKVMSMGILLIATLVVSNTNGSVIAQSNNNAVSGEYKVTISQLPKQTADASTDVTLSNIGPSDDRGSAK